jgi:prevent-host-death family protein
VKEISISEFKTKFDKTIKRAQKTKRPFRVTRRGKTIAEVLVLKAHSRHGSSQVDRFIERQNKDLR